MITPKEVRELHPFREGYLTPEIEAAIDAKIVETWDGTRATFERAYLLDLLRTLPGSEKFPDCLLFDTFIAVYKAAWTVEIGGYNADGGEYTTSQVTLSVPS